ncbi:MAG TPA: hypothetical protein VNM43_09240 [Dehalococcoidia bacterium]|nr:hypothetical protein [Dehalococcoidia bacterium]
MLGRARVAHILRGRSRLFAIAVAALFLHAFAQPQALLRQAEPPAAHVSIDNCDGGPTGCKVLPFAQFAAQAPATERRLEPPPPFASSAPSDWKSRYETPLQDVEPPPRLRVA